MSYLTIAEGYFIQISTNDGDFEDHPDELAESIQKACPSLCGAKILFHDNSNYFIFHLGISEVEHMFNYSSFHLPATAVEDGEAAEKYKAHALCAEQEINKFIREEGLDLDVESWLGRMLHQWS